VIRLKLVAMAADRLLAKIIKEAKDFGAQRADVVSQRGEKRPAPLLTMEVYLDSTQCFFVAHVG
jgi:hypothetical protein